MYLLAKCLGGVLLKVLMIIAPRKPSGFTIIELLIVIVIIAILAAITLVAYSSIQQRANNAVVKTAAAQTLKLITAYISTNGVYPNTSGGCAVLAGNTGHCSSGTANNNGLQSGLVNQLAAIGTVPPSVPVVDPNYNGILYDYNASRTMNGIAAPAILYYYLQGSGVDCGGIGNLANSASLTMTTSSNPYSSTTSTATMCVMSISGPAT